MAKIAPLGWVEMVPPGKATTEYAQARSGGTWGVVALLLGVLTTLASVVAESLGTGTKGGIYAGAVVAFAGVLLKMCTSLGYIRGRSDVKSAALMRLPTPDKGD